MNSLQHLYMAYLTSLYTFCDCHKSHNAVIFTRWRQYIPVLIARFLVTMTGRNSYFVIQQ